MNHRTPLIATILAAALVLTGCAAGSPGASSSNARSSTSSSFPLDITNCGRPLAFDTPPTRIVSLWPAITEMLISLHQTDHVVGQAFTDQSPPLATYAKDYDSIHVLGTDSIGAETLLAAKPQLVVADGEYHFDGKELPTIAALKALGVQVYIISSFCNGAVTTGHVTDAKTDLEALGRITDSTATATKLAASIDSRLAKVTAATASKARVPLALVQFYDTDLYADARGLYSDVVNRAGGENLYEDALPADQYYATISIEDITKRNPSTIVYLYNSDADRAQQLASLTRQLPTVAAVKSGRLIALPSTDFIGSRAVDGVVELQKALAALGS